MPEEAYRYASDAIDDYLRAHGDVTGICSLAAGSDQLFASKIIERGSTLHVIVPCYDYEKTFDAQGLRKYQELLASASQVETLDYDRPSEQAFLEAGKRVADLSDELLAVWDGKKAQGLGGTADAVRHAKELGKAITILWPEGVTR